MPPKVFAILPGLIPSTIINVITPLIDLHQTHLIEARVKLERSVKDKDIDWSDLIIYCRNVEPLAARWLLMVTENNKPYIYDIDDNFFELPPDTPQGIYHTSPERLAMLEEYIQHANLVRVYSEPMFERAKSLNPFSLKVNGPVDWRLVNQSRQISENKPVKIVYATSRVKDNLAEIFKPALIKVLEKYKDRVQVYFLGYNPPEFKTYANVFFKPLNLDYEKYMRYFSSTGFDIGLAPLLDDIFHRSKTNLKVREYGACHIAGIYSDVDAYSTSVTHNKNGLLVKNTPEAWYSAMSVLIENRKLRLQIQEQAYQYARDHFSQAAFTQVWYSQISEVLNRSFETNEGDCSVHHRIFAQGKINSTLGDNSVTGPDLVSWLGMLFMRLVAGMKAEGISFLISYIRLKVQLFWNLLKIKFTLFFH